MAKHKLLVIGSKGHIRADCLDWLEVFPNIEEYDSIIINMQSLSQKEYDVIQSKIKEIKESIRIIMETGREIFCIINKLMTPSPPPRNPAGPRTLYLNPDYVSPTNYDWLPSNIFLDSRKTGNTISIINMRFKNYFDFVHDWNYEISLSAQTIQGNIYSNFLNAITPIAVNKSEKIVAASIWKIEDRKKALENKNIGMVHLLPPPKETNMFEAIEKILDIIIGTENKIIVPWRKQVEVPFEKFFEEKIRQKNTQIVNIEQEISQLHEQIKVYDMYRDLLTETGEHLENIVQKTLDDIGLKTKKAEKGYPADLLSKEIAVEITGIKNCVGADSNKVTQIGRFIQNYREREKVVLVVNTYMDMPPNDRKGKMNFSPQIRNYLDSFSVCYLTTQTLFELWKTVVFGKKEKVCVQKRILDTIGEVTV